MKALRQKTRYRVVVVWKDGVDRPEGSFDSSAWDERPNEYESTAYTRLADAVSGAKGHWLDRKQMRAAIEKVIIRKEVTRYETVEEFR